MKTTPLSFLFFYTITIIFFFIGLKAHAQEDSLSIYYYRIWKPDSIKNVSLDKAISFYKRKLEISESSNDIKTAVYDLRTITEGYILQGNYFYSEMYATRALELLDNQPLDAVFNAEKSRISNELGRMYWSLDNYDQAIKYYGKALELAENSKDSISCYNNIGLAYLDWNRFKDAESAFNIALKKTIILKDTINQWIISNNIGFIEFNLDKSKGLNKMIEARDNMLRNGTNIRDVFANTYYLASFYITHKNFQTANTYISQGLEIANSIKNPLFKHKILALKAQIHDDFHMQEYQRLNDSLSLAEKQAEHKYTSQKYNYEKAEKERSKAQLNSTIIAGIASIITLIATFSFFYFRQRNRLEKDRERHRTERALSKKVHDEVGNDLFYLMTQIQSSPHEFLEQNGLKLLDGLNEIYGKARDISKHYTAVHTGPNYNNELLSLLNSYGSDQIKIITNKIDPSFWETVEPHKKENLYRILQELLTNMKKHSNANFVAVTFTKDTENIHVKYVDNGCGVDLKTLTLKNGLDNVESRMVDLKGSITFESVPNKGFKAFIKLST